MTRKLTIVNTSNHAHEDVHVQAELVRRGEGTESAVAKNLKPGDSLDIDTEGYDRVDIKAFMHESDADAEFQAWEVDVRAEGEDTGFRSDEE